MKLILPAFALLMGLMATAAEKPSLLDNNPKCVFCQNHDTSQAGHGREVLAPELAAMMLELQQVGCHNINLVTHKHAVPQMLEALTVVIEGGL